MRYKDLVVKGEKTLKKHNLDPQLSSYLIKYLLHLNDEDKVNNINIYKRLVNKYNKAIERLINGEPVQYITGDVNFFGYNFKVSKSVLIPRFETEELVNETKKYIKKHFKEDISLVDIGTGSGAIGITLKKELPNIEVTLTDKSKRALNIASINARQVEANVDILHGNMLKPLIEQNRLFSVLISNPPYIKLADAIMPIVALNEPKMALYGGEDGLKYYRKILKDANKILTPKSLIALEILDKEENKLRFLVEKYFPNTRYEIKKDFQGRNRMLFIFNNLHD
jgi:release factor glutamine methyltransferase